MPKVARPRVYAACNICRERKVKCDKTHPVCKVCAAHGVGHLCKYGLPKWVDKVAEPNGKIESQVPRIEATEREKQLYKKVRQLEEELDVLRIEKERQEGLEVCCFGPALIRFDPETQCAKCSGELSTLGICFSDPFFVGAWKTLKRNKKIDTASSFRDIMNARAIGAPTDHQAPQDVQRNFERRILDTFKAQSLKASQMHVTLPLPIISSSKLVPFDSATTLRKVLPTQRAIWLLLDRFFKYVHPLFPYVDQQRFSQSVVALLGTREEPTKLNLKTERDYITMGTLLLVIYLGGLTLKTCLGAEYDPEDEDVKYLRDHPVDKKTIYVSRVCVHRLLYLGRCQIYLAKFYIYLKVVLQCAPERVEPIDNHQLADLITNLLVDLGLNRERRVANFSKNFVNLSRKIWYGNMSDTFFTQYLNSGSMIRQVEYDIRLPIYQGPDNSNNNDLDLEQATVFGVRLASKFQKIYDSIQQKVMDRHSQPTLAEVRDHMARLEDLINELPSCVKLHTLEPEESVASRIRRVTQFKIYIESRCMQLSLYAHLFFFYERKEQSTNAFYTLRKCLEISEDVFVLCTRLLPCLPAHFGEGFDYVLAPTLLLGMNRLRPIICLGVLRGMHVVYTKARDCTLTPSLISVINQLEERIYGVYKEIISTYSKLSFHYFHAWRMSKVESYRLRSNTYLREHWLDITAENVDEDIPKQNAMLEWTDDQFEELFQILDQNAQLDSVEVPDLGATTRILSETDLLDADWIVDIFDHGLSDTGSMENELDLDRLLRTIADYPM